MINAHAPILATLRSPLCPAQILVKAADKQHLTAILYNMHIAEFTTKSKYCPRND